MCVGTGNAEAYLVVLPHHHRHQRRYHYCCAWCRRTCYSLTLSRPAPHTSVLWVCMCRVCGARGYVREEVKSVLGWARLADAGKGCLDIAKHIAKACTTQPCACGGGA